MVRWHVGWRRASASRATCSPPTSTPGGWSAAATPANVEVRRHSVVDDPLPDAHFDLVHERLVVMHLPEREAALRSMVASLRPGGWILVEDFDSDIAPEAFPSPQSDDEELGNKVVRSIRALLAQRGADTAFGHKLPRLLGAAGLEEVGADAYQAIEAGDAIRQLQRANIRQVGDRARRAGARVASRARAVRGPARRTQGEPELAAARVGVGTPPGRVGAQAGKMASVAQARAPWLTMVDEASR